MDMDSLPFIVQSAIGGVISGIAFWATVRVEIKWLRRDVDELMKKVN